MMTDRKPRKTASDPVPRISRSHPVEYYVLADVEHQGRVIGHLAGRPILECVVDAEGGRYRFAGVAPRDATGRFDVLSLKTGEWIVQPGLIYAAETP
ncbi:hypothetical protein [Rhizobium sp. CAU 1783]